MGRWARVGVPVEHVNELTDDALFLEALAHYEVLESDAQFTRKASSLDIAAALSSSVALRQALAQPSEGKELVMEIDREVVFVLRDAAPDSAGARTRRAIQTYHRAVADGMPWEQARMRAKFSIPSDVSADAEAIVRRRRARLELEAIELRRDLGDLREKPPHKQQLAIADWRRKRKKKAERDLARFEKDRRTAPRLRSLDLLKQRCTVVEPERWVTSHCVV
jgi:hypothetical protein